MTGETGLETRKLEVEVAVVAKVVEVPLGIEYDPSPSLGPALFADLMLYDRLLYGDGRGLATGGGGVRCSAGELMFHAGGRLACEDSGEEGDACDEAASSSAEGKIWQIIPIERRRRSASVRGGVSPTGDSRGESRGEVEGGGSAEVDATGCVRGSVIAA